VRQHNIHSTDTPPVHRVWVVAVLADGQEHIARYSRVNHVWTAPGGAVVWPVAWYED